jgi:hypothetical protein
MGLHEIKKFLQKNGHRLKRKFIKITESLCQVNIWQRINNQNILGAYQTKLTPKNNDPVKKCANELYRVFSKEEVQMAKNT